MHRCGHSCDAGVLVYVVRAVGEAGGEAGDGGCGAVAHRIVGVGIGETGTVVGTADLVGGVVAVGAGGGAAAGEGFIGPATGGVERIAVAGYCGAALLVEVGEELAGGVVGLFLGDAVFVGEGGEATGFVVGVVCQWWRAVAADVCELAFRRPCVIHGRAAGAVHLEAEAICIGRVRDNHGGLSGEGLGFGCQLVSHVVGIVTF